MTTEQTAIPTDSVPLPEPLQRLVLTVTATGKEVDLTCGAWVAEQVRAYGDARAAEAESRIVAWLRSVGRYSPVDAVMDDAADRIEPGHHRPDADR